MESGNVAGYKVLQMTAKEYQLHILLRQDTNTSHPLASRFCFKVENSLSCDLLVYFRFSNLSLVCHDQQSLNIVVDGSYHQVKLHSEPGHSSFVYYLKKQSVTMMSSDYVYGVHQLQAFLNKLEQRLFTEAV